jgi:hypothetical protein
MENIVVLERSRVKRYAQCDYTSHIAGFGPPRRRFASPVHFVYSFRR